MTAELANALLALAALLSLALSGGGVISAFRGSAIPAQLSGRTTIGIFALVTAALGLLFHAFAVSDFSVANVYQNSHTAKPMLYKITGSWGNHEGSMLLWVWMVTAFAAAYAVLNRKTQDERLFNGGLVSLALVSAGFLLFILLTSNPFDRIDPVPFQGQDLNPLLQDIGLAIHPPLLYLGYVGFSVVFALTAGALLTGREIDSTWAKQVQPWALLAWGLLTWGIGLGSWWAYRELGWGGWWFWDPVENISLLPWLSGTALIHCLLVLGKRPMLQNWTLLLSILTFALSLMGTFLVRSGLLTSVHSFASDPERGMYILLFATTLIGGSLWLYAVRYPKPTAPDFTPVSREGGILVNNLLLLTACATVFLGIIYPIMLQVFDLPSVSVGAPYYDAIMLPLAVPLLLMAAIGPMLAWKNAVKKAVLRQAKQSALFTAAIALLIIWLQSDFIADVADMVIAIVCACAGVILLGATIAYGRREWRVQHGRLPLHSMGILLAHGGLAIFAIAATFASAGRFEREMLLAAGEKQRVEGYEVSYDTINRWDGGNYAATGINLRFTGVTVAEGFMLRPESRFYAVRRMETAESSINSNLVRDVYAAISLMPDRQDAVLLRLYIVPAAVWLWLGFVITGFGGILASAGYLRRNNKNILPENVPSHEQDA